MPETQISARLSDRILSALELSLEQGDVEISEALTSALELAMTRTAGGGEFVERREYPPELAEVMNRLKAVKDNAKSSATG